MNTVDQMLSIRTQHQSLNPFATNPNTGEKIINKETGEFELNPSFEKNFNNQITKPIFKSLSESAPKGKNGESTFVNPEVLFLKAEDAKMQMQEGNTAEFLPEQNKVLVDLFEMIVDDIVDNEELTSFQFPSKRATFIRVSPLSDNMAKKSRSFGKYADVDVFATNFKVYSFGVEIEKQSFTKSFILYTNTKAYKELMEKANTGYKF